ncbi:helix-turn-helix domain-containing protein [Gracilibacillus sp. YIM 98692]|uniref:helix-turn-helix domain-containing protein n=1 Tax=Gracilibacillus sp. YIM 98692 TaxID=2663532 RepID=UPI0013D65737|nr:helix-turn-helix domain-containing protein [Gracilibacillus sp. YIM 98692]
MGIGERLKTEREEQNMSLEEIQRHTKIQKRYLYAIETENFDIMPGSFYVRAFIKEYANAVGLNADDLMEEYQADLPLEPEEKVMPSRVNSSRKNKASLKTPAIFSFLPTIIVILLITGIVLVVWLFKQGGLSDTETDPANNVVEEEEGSTDEVELPPTEEETNSSNSEGNQNGTDDGQQGMVDSNEVTNEGPEENMEIQLDRYENNQSYYTVENAPETIPLSVSSENKNWLEIENSDGERLHYANLTADQSPFEVELTEAEQLYFRFAEPQNLTIYLNDQLIELSEEVEPNTTQEVWIKMNQS